MRNGISDIRGGDCTNLVNLCANHTISLIRLIAMSFIILCHLMQYLNCERAWWFNVGVQIFLCISGFLYGQKNICELTSFYSRRFKKILIPYYIVFLIYAFFQFVFAHSVFSITNFIRGIFVNSTLQGAGHLWFVPTILMCYIITPLLQQYRGVYVSNRKSFAIFTVLSIGVVSLFFGGFARFFNPEVLY